MTAEPPLRLHYNENTAGCSPAVASALAGLSEMAIGTYPDIGPVTRRTAAYLGVEPGQVLLTNGLDEGLHATAAWAARSMAGTARRPEVIIVEPTFEMYAEFSEMVGATVVRVPCDANFTFPLERVLAAITPNTRVVYLADPNNPTGLPVPEGAAERIAGAAEQAIVFVDEAYADFSGRTLIGPVFDRAARLVVGRTFAKGHGLAGLRVGAVVGQHQIVAELARLVAPFSINVCAIRGLEAALDDPAYLADYVRQCVESRELAYAFCRERGLTYWPSEGNFVLMRVGAQASSVASALEARGVLVRDKSQTPGCAGCLRITTGVVAHTRRALALLEDCLASRTN